MKKMRRKLMVAHIYQREISYISLIFTYETLNQKLVF